MAYAYFIYLVIASLVATSFQDTTNNEISDADSPLADVAKEILKEKNLENIGGMVSSFLQSDGGKVILDNVMSKISSPDSIGNIAQVLGGIVNTAGSTDGHSNTDNKENTEVNPMELLSGLGSIMGALQGGNGNNGGGSAALLQGLGSILAANTANNEGGSNAANIIQGLSSVLGSTSESSDDNDSGAILQGLGSLIASAAANKKSGGEGNFGILESLGSLVGNQGGQPGLNPELIGSVLNMFAGAGAEEKPTKKSTNSKTKKSKKARTKKEAPEFDISNAIQMAQSLLNNGDKTKNGRESLTDYLPMIMNTISAFTGPVAQQRADSHSNHKGMLPKILEKFHVFFDIFLHSDIGKTILGYLGTEKTFKKFQDENGQFNYKKFQELFENHSFRKHCIQQITKKLVRLLKLAADENIQNQYIFSGLSFINAFLQSNGFPQSTLINIKDPINSISNFINYAMKKYLDAENVDSKEYVKPVVLYIKDILKLSRNAIKIKHEPKELTAKLTDTVNMDVIEPIIRVNRAYRFAKAEPSCDRYIFCMINRETTPITGSLPVVNKALSKGTSLVAAWFVTTHTGTSYWDLYSDIIGNQNCKALYNNKCNGFHEEEVKVTTEYVHTEL